jgi:hypothetical protein
MTPLRFGRLDLLDGMAARPLDRDRQPRPL